MDREISYKVEIRKNSKTGKSDIYKITTYGNLTENEADELIENLEGKKNNKEFTVAKSVKSFLYDTYGKDEDDPFSEELATLVYKEYVDYCKENNLVGIVTNVSFGKIICSKYGYTTKVFNYEGKSVRKYIKIEEV